jgi:hypothetical protein
MQLPCVSDPLLVHKQKGRSLRASRAHRQPHPPKASSKPAPSFLATRACVFCSGRQLVRRWRARIVVHDPRERKRHCSVRCPSSPLPEILTHFAPECKTARLVLVGTSTRYRLLTPALLRHARSKAPC